MLLHVLWIGVGGTLTLFLLFFAATSLRERKWRAAAISAGIALLGGALWFGGHLWWGGADIGLAAPSLAVLGLTALFFAPIGSPSRIQVGRLGERVDERDVMFAREEYRPGSEKHREYYSRRPELKAIDDKIRALPELLSPGGRFYDPVGSPYTASIFSVIEGMLDKVDGPVADARALGEAGTDAQANTDTIKRLARHLGAAEVGIARLNAAFVYSHVGRGPEPWGAPIRLAHKYAIAFSVEMDHERVETAPRIGITEESARQYLRGAAISITLAAHIRGLGYPARAHVAGSNYQIMLPPVAHDAGLGELGRFGYLISRRIGARVRLGAVTTDLPLVPDRPVAFGVQEFCRACRRCAANCPSGSIPRGEKTEVRGVRKWPLEMESCLRYWRYIGTDCGLCMRVCPYSHPRSLVHDLVRAGISRSAFARRVALWGEDLFYGKRVRSPRDASDEA